MIVSLRALIASAGAGLAACGAPAASVVKDEPPAPALALDLSFTGTLGTPGLVAHCAAKNISSQPVHVFDSARMPYLIVDQGTLVVLHGVSPPGDRLLGAIEIPLTRVLPPGETLAFDVPLAPLHLRSHYGDEPDPGLHGATPIVCRVAHGATPIDAAARAHTTITALLAWQQFDASPTLVVKLP
ncbi:MAG TPA: hypothetical protein VF516_17300 [Kofleriaceae bacterium]